MRKKNKKGFTLVELLAVIVILAIILVIAVPKISNVIESSKKSTFEETALNIVKAANYYYATSLLETSEQDIKKYNEQYTNLEVIYNNIFHDRYIILDEDIVYHLGSSLNYIGNKTFSINKIDEVLVKKALLLEINNLNRI